MAERANQADITIDMLTTANRGLAEQNSRLKTELADSRATIAQLNNEIQRWKLNQFKITRE